MHGVIEKMQAAMAEVGVDEPLRAGPFGGVVFRPGTSPRVQAAIWQAGSLVKPGGVPCWACWQKAELWSASQVALDCVDGRCQSPEGPSRPPRELLLGSVT